MNFSSPLNPLTSGLAPHLVYTMICKVRKLHVGYNYRLRHPSSGLEILSSRPNGLVGTVALFNVHVVAYTKIFGAYTG